MELSTGFMSWTNGAYSEGIIAELQSKMKATVDIYSIEFHRAVDEGFYSIIQKIRDEITKLTHGSARVHCFSVHHVLITSLDKEAFAVVSDTNRSNSNPWDKIDRTINVDAHGTHTFVERLNQFLNEHIVESKVPTVTWEYITDGKRSRQLLHIERAKPVLNEFYPWIGDVNPYLDRYLASESPILVLLGEAGTAKTSFIRYLIWRNAMNTMFTYDETLLTSDAMFADFIVGETDLLVVEDADVFLKSRQHDGNRIMSKFLNIGDGLAANHKKKIIFTANIVDPEHIDSALIRPGRCFDCKMFRPLTYTEARDAAQAAHINVPTVEKSYTLAELFANAKEEPAVVIRKKLGFGI